MSTDAEVAFNVVGIVASLVCIAQGMGRFGSPWWSLAGMLFLGLNVFLLVGNLGGVS